MPWQWRGSQSGAYIAQSRHTGQRERERNRGRERERNRNRRRERQTGSVCQPKTNYGCSEERKVHVQYVHVHMSTCISELLDVSYRASCVCVCVCLPDPPIYTVWWHCFCQLGYDTKSQLVKYLPPSHFFPPPLFSPSLLPSFPPSLSLLPPFFPPSPSLPPSLSSLPPSLPPSLLSPLPGPAMAVLRSPPSTLPPSERAEETISLRSFSSKVNQF